MTSIPKRITEAFISRTDDIELLKECAYDLADRAAYMMACARDTEAMWANPTFASIQYRWDMLATKIGFDYDFGDAIC